MRFRPGLTAHRGKLLSKRNAGSAVHAGTFPRKREMVLDRELLEKPSELARIFVHELFHFAWVRLGNTRRRSFETLLASEFGARARGELGWSAESRKHALTPRDRRLRTRHWRAYVCESFCDSAAWLYAGIARHQEFTLAPRFRAARRAWFREYIAGGPVSI